MAAIATRILILALLSAAPVAAADLLPLTAAQQKNLGIKTAEVGRQDAGPALTYPAQVSFPPASVRVIAAAGDALVTRVHVQAGESVKRGASLVTLSMPGLADAHNTLTQARLSARLAASNAARDEKLFAEGLIAEARLRASQSEARSARAHVSAAQTTLSLLGGGKVAGSSITLSAPIAGVVTESMAEPGERVDAGTALVKVADLTKLALDIPLSTAQSQQIAVGQTVTVRDSEARGQITAVLPQLNSAQSVLVRASLTDPQHLLRPGQSVRVAITGGQSAEQVVVPASAVVWKVNVPYVFVESAKGYTPIQVKLIRRNASQAAVEGVTVGSRVAVQGVAALKAQWLEE